MIGYNVVLLKVPGFYWKRLCRAAEDCGISIEELFLSSALEKVQNMDFEKHEQMVIR